MAEEPKKNECCLSPEQLEQAIAKIKWRIQKEHPFFSPISVMTKINWIEDLPYGSCAATDGKEVVITNGFLKKPFKEQMGIMLHELLHILWLHPVRYKDMGEGSGYRVVYNILTDCRINEEIRKKLDTEIDGGVYHENVFKTLKKVGFEEKEGFDLENAIAKVVSEEVDEYNADEAFNYVKNFIKPKDDEGSWGEGGGLGRDLKEPAQPLTQEQKQALEREVRDAIVRGIVEEKMRGTTRGNWSKEFEDFVSRTEVNWKVIVKNYIRRMLRGERTYQKLHKKSFNRGVLVAGFRRKPQVKLVVGIDVSGSISDETYKHFIGELITLARQFKAETKVVPFDVDVKGEYIVKSKRDIPNLKTRMGYGGTAYSDFLDKYGEEKIKVIMTDGYGDQGGEPFRIKYRKYQRGIVWITTHCEEFPFGRVVKIND